MKFLLKSLLVLSVVFAAPLKASTLQVNLDFVINLNKVTNYSSDFFGDTQSVVTTQHNITGTASLVFDPLTQEVDQISNQTYIPAKVSLKYNNAQNFFFDTTLQAQIYLDINNHVLKISHSEFNSEFTGNFVETHDWGSLFELTYSNLPILTQLSDLDEDFWVSILNENLTLFDHSFDGYSGIYIGQYYSHGSYSDWTGNATVESVINTPLPGTFWLFTTGLIFLFRRQRLSLLSGVKIHQG